jgi:DNA-binding MarR family transcriptional regulator
MRCKHDRVEDGPKPRTRPDDVLLLESFLSFRVSILAKLLERRLARMLSERFGLAVAEYRVLAQVAMRPGSTVRAISARTFVDKAQVSRVVAALEEQDLVKRSTRDNDRRSPEFTITPSGRALINRIVPLRLQQEQDIGEHLGAVASEQLAGAVQSLIGMLSEPGRETEPESTAMQRRKAIRTERMVRSRARAAAKAAAAAAQT